MKKTTVWFTYDLGVGGDFQNLYAWLDDHEAKECGNNVAFIGYSYPTIITTDKKFTDHLVDDLKKTITIQPSNRIYIVYRSLENKEKFRGTFIIGKRKANPWEGFGEKTVNESDE